jgi:hypothetical protein
MTKQRLWRTKNGELVDISKMKTNHIVSCIELIETKAKELVIDGLITGTTGSLAEDMYGDIIDVNHKEAIRVFEPQYSWLKEELNNRKLTQT